MATSYKILGQASPNVDTDTDLYTVPAATSAIVSSIVVCHFIGSVSANTGATALLNFAVWVRVAGAAKSDSNKLIATASVGAGSTIVLKLGITLAATDVITVRESSTGGTAAPYLTFTAFGCEIT